MKRLIIISLMLLPLVCNAKDEPTFGKFAIQPTHQAEEYQQYVGKTFRYLPSNPLGYAESNVFKFKGIPGNDYILISVAPNTGYVDNYKNIIFTFQEKGGKGKKYKIKSWYTMNDALPFLNVEAFEKEKASLVGKTYSNPKVKATYTITDITLKTDNSKRLVPTYVMSDGQEFRSLEGIEDKLFRRALDGSYVSTLVRVEKPEDSTDKYSEVKSIVEKGVTKYSFEDDLISIVIFGGSSQFSFKLSNKSQNSIKVIWDDAVFVDYEGSISKIMHSGIKYSQKEASQPASTIIRGASLDDIACPTSNVRYSDVLKDWVTDSMYPTLPSKEVKQIRLMLPIQIKEVVNEYVFIFDVEYRYKHPELLNLD